MRPVPSGAEQQEYLSRTIREERKRQQRVRLAAKKATPRRAGADQAPARARTSAGSSEPKRLSPRQRQVLAGLAKNQTNASVASALGVSIKTVEAHRAEILRRTGTRTRSGLARAAVEFGLAKPRRLAESKPLSPRVREVLALLAQDLTMDEIAEHLHISVKTVEVHRQNLGRKFGTASRVPLTFHVLATEGRAQLRAAAARPTV